MCSSGCPQVPYKKSVSVHPVHGTPERAFYRARKFSTSAPSGHGCPRQNIRAATLQKCGSENFLRFSLCQRCREIWREIFRATFSRVSVCDGKIHQNFTSKTVWKTENFTQISLCRCTALKNRGKKVYTTTAGPLFSRSVARPRAHRAKKAMVSTIFLGKQGKRVYTIGPERRAYTIEPQTREKKKRRVSTVVVYTLFFPAKCLFFQDF